MSTCTQRVAIVCKEIGIDYELTIVDMANGEHKTPDYVENKQPFGAVPVLVVGSIASHIYPCLMTYLSE